MLQQLKEDVEIVIAINAADIEKNKVRGDLGISYDEDVLRLIDSFRGLGLYVGSVVVTQYDGQSAGRCLSPSAWRPWACRCYRHYPIAGYPHNVALIVSDEGFGKQRLYRDQPLPGGGHRPRPRQRQDGHLPQPALPRAQAGHPGGLRQV